MTTNNLYIALDLMPQRFSSNEFSAICQRNGVSKEYCASGRLGEFLHKYAIQLESKRMWMKKPNFKDVIKVNNQYTSLTEKEAIDYLKKLGYKIYKPQTEFKEV